MQMNPPLSALLPAYRGLICDIWGVLHNGVQAFAPAVEALVQARKAGCAVVLVSNAPRPAHCIVPQLDALHVPKDAYDRIITSGDLVQEWLLAHPNTRIWHIGPTRDLPLFEGAGVTLTSADDAEAIVCTGPYDDENDTPDMYRDTLMQAVQRGLVFVCANPDLVVERGTKLIYCAGALADLYQELGGTVLYMGKPHAAIYHQAVLALSQLTQQDLGARDILAIGDAVRTDLKGAALMGMDALFVASGIHAKLAGTPPHFNLEPLTALFFETKTTPKAIAWSLVW